jgi:hypothetical protein
MSCTTSTASLTVNPAPEYRRPQWPPVIKTIIAILDAFHEALEMRRVALKKYRLNDE